ncbi:MAG TPA: RNase adapter RapZ [Bacillota bacterium]|nr:RNase adapter RapZ [Bacillota bacterium]HOG52353.1 RNase adapter RapZ [Bacillota bacterium]
MDLSSSNGKAQEKPEITLLSFGYKYGVPDYVEFLFDVRYLRNPYYEAELKELNGNYKSVSDYVLQDPLAESLVSQIFGFIDSTSARYTEKGRGWMVVGVGCTGGKHRSVAVVNELQKRLKKRGFKVNVLHRDIYKEMDPVFGQDPAWTGFERDFSEESKGRGMRVAAIGGGTGMPVVLRGLKHYTSNITAIVTMTDDGGSSGRLVEEMEMPPPGDIRNCILAMSNTEPLMEKLFQYRFSLSGKIAGHPFGNLFLAAMTDITGDFQKAIKECSAVLSVRGEVLPATMSMCVLKAEMYDGKVVYGESNISRSKSRIKRLSIEPQDAKPHPSAISAILNADLVVIGPGSLYTSIITNLLIPQVADALRASKARKIYVCNTMTEAGETIEYSAMDHLNAMFDHAGQGICDSILVNNSRIPEELLKAYRKEGAAQVSYDAQMLREMGLTVGEFDVASAGEHYKHDPYKLARAIMSMIS